LADLLRHKGLAEFCGFSGGAAPVRGEPFRDGGFWKGGSVVHRSEGPFFRHAPVIDCDWLEMEPAFFNRATGDEPS
jgi:hypothetical protein